MTPHPRSFTFAQAGGSLKKAGGSSKYNKKEVLKLKEVFDEVTRRCKASSPF